jgi:hypothetical protein
MVKKHLRTNRKKIAEVAADFDFDNNCLSIINRRQ